MSDEYPIPSEGSRRCMIYGGESDPPTAVHALQQVWSLYKTDSYYDEEGEES